MYKEGDKVETPLGVGVITTIFNYKRFEDDYFVKFENVKNEVCFVKSEIKPYKTAHEKLLELGYERIEGNKILFYANEEKSTIGIYKKSKDYKCNEVDLELSKILTQYLKEMEQDNE